ncbi:MAG: hypothetical protein V4660_04920 [Pseudomonadota bacterium]
MTMQQRALLLLKNIFILSLIAVVSACGGGGKKKDLIPDNFSFTAVAGAAVSTEVISNTITVTSINKPVGISITGGTYSIGSGDYTGATGTITNGQTVKVKVLTSASNSTAVTSTLTIGGVTGSFSVTTIAADATPNAFVLTAVTDVQPGSVNTSAVVTVTGINVTVPISITGGEYSINGGTYTSLAGTVSTAQVVTVRATAATTSSTAKDAVLTIGGVSATYTVTTIADTVAPTAQILFPPVVSMTEGNTILVRGTASDAYSIASVKVNGVTAITTDGFANWQALVTLTDTTAPVTLTTENTITVVTEDHAGNIAADAAHVAVRQAPITSAFPDSDNQFNGRAWSVVIDRLDGRNRLLVTRENSEILSVDLSTGKRTIFTTGHACSFLGMGINTIAKHLYASCSDSLNGRVFDFNLADSSQFQIHSSSLYKLIGPIFVDVSDSKIFTANDGDGAVIFTDTAFTSYNILSNATTPTTSNAINNAYGLAKDNSRNRFLVSDYSQQTVFAVNAATGARTVFSNNATGTGDAFGTIFDKYVSGLVIDEFNQRALLTEALSGKIFAIDLITGNRSLVTSNTSANSFNAIGEGWHMVIDDPKGYAFVADDLRGTILAVDLVTGQRVVFSQ